MNSSVRISGLLLAGWLGCPLQPLLAMGLAPPAGPEASDLLLARGGGGGGMRGGGGGGGLGGRGGAGGGGGGSFAGRGQTGFQNAGGAFNRGDARPTGGWSNRVSAPDARPSLDRPAMNPGGGTGFSRDQPLGGNRAGSASGNRLGGLNNGAINRPGSGISGGAYGNRTGNRYGTITGGRQVNINSLNVSPGWARPGWGVARPWGNVGWYGGWARPPWGWWGASAAAWGIGTLASAAIINSAVNSAINSQSTYIVVPDTDFQLLYGTVSPVGNSGVSFAATINGTTVEMTADCQAGTLNNQTPSSAAAAQLLNAACQVAYGNV